MVALSSSAEKSVPKVRQAAILIVIRHVYSLDLANEPASLHLGEEHPHRML